MCKGVGDFSGSIGFWGLNHVRNRGTSFASCAAPGWLSDSKALLTRKFPMFLSRLNEASSGRGNMCLILGSLRRILKFLIINAIFDCKVLWMVGEGEWNSVGFFVLCRLSALS